MRGWLESPEIVPSPSPQKKKIPQSQIGGWLVHTNEQRGGWIKNFIYSKSYILTLSM